MILLCSNDEFLKIELSKPDKISFEELFGIHFYDMVVFILFFLTFVWQGINRNIKNEISLPAHAARRSRIKWRIPNIICKWIMICWYFICYFWCTWLSFWELPHCSQLLAAWLVKVEWRCLHDLATASCRYTRRFFTVERSEHFTSTACTIVFLWPY